MKIPSFDVLIPSVLVSAIWPAVAFGQSVPGFEVTVYASVDNPSLLAFAPDGTLFSGRDAVVTGSATPVKIHRIGVGGSPVEEFGETTTPDPDTPIVDVSGSISGVAGSVIVGGLVPPANAVGRISAIHPDQSIAILFESAPIGNPIEMKFDLDGRLLFTEGNNPAVWVIERGGLPTPFIDLPGGVNCGNYLAVSPDNLIYTSACDGVIRIYGQDGMLIDSSFADVDTQSSIEFGPGGAFGDDLYALSRTTGLLVRIDETGAVHPFGSGFPASTFDLAVGPDGALYVSSFVTDQVFRIAPLDCPEDLNQDGQVNGADLGQLLLAWNTGTGPADLSGDGIVNGADLGILLLAWGPCP